MMCSCGGSGVEEGCHHCLGHVQEAVWAILSQLPTAPGKRTSPGSKPKPASASPFEWTFTLEQGAPRHAA